MRDKGICKILEFLVFFVVVASCITLCIAVEDNTENSASANVVATSSNIKLYLSGENLSENYDQKLEQISFMDGGISSKVAVRKRFIYDDGDNWTWGNYFLGGDINGASYGYRLFLASDSSTTFKIEININGTTVATFPLLTVPYNQKYQPFSENVTGLDPTTSRGDKVTLKITKISGSRGSILLYVVPLYITIPPLACDEIWVGNTSYGGEVWFTVSENKVKSFRLFTKGASGDVINETGDKVGSSYNEWIFSRTINATIINNQFTYSLTHGENVEEILGVFTSDRNANGTFGLQVEGFYSSKFTCIYPLISWNATKVYAPTETPVHQSDRNTVTPTKSYLRECEDVDDYTVGNPNIWRTHASQKKVLGQFGCESKPPWNSKSGYAKYNNIHLIETGNLSIMIRYSCNNAHSTPISIYFDDEPKPRRIFYTQNTHDWNTFRETDKINLGATIAGYHSLTFKTEGVKYGAADLDYFILSTQSNQSNQKEIRAAQEEVIFATDNVLSAISPDDEEFLDTVEFKTFLFFYENTDERGFTIDSTACPIGNSASSGFYLTLIPIAIERGWISYEDGYQRVNTTLNNYYDDPGDPDDFYVESEHGFFPHWFHQETGKWNEVDCFSSIDTAIFMAGVLTVSQYFADTEIETVATKLYEDVDWEWMLNGSDTLSMGWRPDTGFLSSRWQGYNEGMLAVLLALGSPTHFIPDESWDAWTRTYKQAEYTYENQSYTFVESTSTSLFTYQYPLIWFDLRDKTDRTGINYPQNSVNATLENRAYCIENPKNHKGYGSNVWGLTACECPLHESNYGAHGPRQDDDGTVSPAGVGGSIIFTPHESVEALRYMNDSYGAMLWGKYGFKDAFNLDIDWFSSTYIGIDQGAILTMIENYRSGLVQSLFMQNEFAEKAMQKAGFTDMDTTSPAITRVEKKNNKVVARVVDNTGVRSVVLYWNDSKAEMVWERQNYSAEVPDDIAWYYIKAEDENGNVATSRIFFPSETPKLPKEEVITLPFDAPSGSLLVDRFDDCMSKKGAGAWQGGSSTPEDCVIMFDSSVNRNETGCSMKIRYDVKKKGAYNGAWIKLDNLDLRDYKELVFWIKGDGKEGYTTKFKIELKSPKGRGEYVVRDATNSWKKITVSLNEFKTSAGAYEIDLSDVTEFTIVFEDWRVTDKEGVIYIDDLYFTPKVTPTPNANT